MSFSNNSSKKGVPLSPGRRSQNNSSYFEKSRELSSKFDDLENKISNLEDECSSFRKAIDDGRKIIQEERNQIDNREKNIQRKIGSTQHPQLHSHAQDFADYSDGNESKEFTFETPDRNKYFSRRQRILESTFSTLSGVNHDNTYMNINNNSDMIKPQNPRSFTPKRDYSSFSISNSDNSFNNDANNSFNYNRNRHNRYDSDGSFEYSQSNANRSNVFNSRGSFSQNDITPVFSQSFEMYKKDEAILGQQVKEMQNKIFEIDRRVSEAQKILTEPIDDIEMPKKLAEEAERNLIKVRDRLNSFENNDNEFEDYAEMINNIEILESKNNKRTKELNVKRKRLDEMKSLILRRRDTFISMAQSRSMINTYNKINKNYLNDNSMHSSRLSSELALKKIDEAHEKLKQRSTSIQEEEEAIDKYENELIQKRKQMEQDWKLKMKHIEKLSSMRRNIDRLKLNINLEETEVEQLKNYLSDLENEKTEISKRIANSIAESTRNFSNYSQTTNDRMTRLNQKRRQIDSINRKLNEKRRKVNRFEESVRKLIISMKLYNDQVEHLEAQVEEMGQTTEEQLEDLQRETTQLSKSLATLKSLSNDKNSYQQNQSEEHTEEFVDLDNYD